MQKQKIRDLEAHEKNEDMKRMKKMSPQNVV